MRRRRHLVSPKLSALPPQNPRHTPGLPRRLGYDRGMDTTTRLLPLNVVARRLRVTVGWLRAEAEAGRIPSLRADKAILCDLAAVEAALLERARQPAGKEGHLDE